MGDWQHGTFGCFDNCYVCLCAWFCPCFVAGKIAESVGDSCLIHCLLTLVPVANLICRCIERGKVRQEKGIDGGQMGDLLCVWCCPFCSLSQEANEMNAMTGSMAEPQQEMVRE